MNVRQLNNKDEEVTRIPPTPPASLDRYRGALLGCALGDSIGALAEHIPVKEAKDFVDTYFLDADFSSIDEIRGFRFGQYTDDTQLSRELILSLIDERGFVPEDYADRIARIFARDGVIGFGGATQMAAIKLIDGVSWESAGTPPPRAGNGAAMRAGPIGLFFYYDVDKCLHAAHNQGFITHQALASTGGALAIATATAMALTASEDTTGPHERGWWSWLAAHVKKENEYFGQAIEDIANIAWEGRRSATWKPGSEEEQKAVLAYVLEGDDPHWDGVSAWAHSSTLWSLYCVMASPTDAWKAMSLAIAVGGDTDTMAAMTGTVMGALLGASSFPQKVMEEFVPRIHDIRAEEYTWEGLDALVTQLHTIVMEQYEERLTEWQKAGES